jgi:hypothetical protein
MSKMIQPDQFPALTEMSAHICLDVLVDAMEEAIAVLPVQNNVRLHEQFIRFQAVLDESYTDAQERLLNE